MGCFSVLGKFSAETYIVNKLRDYQQFNNEKIDSKNINNIFKFGTLFKEICVEIGSLFLSKNLGSLKLKARYVEFEEKIDEIIGDEEIDEFLNENVDDITIQKTDPIIDNNNLNLNIVPNETDTEENDEENGEDEY